jgi:hypothetical protein
MPDQTGKLANDMVTPNYGIADKNRVFSHRETEYEEAEQILLPVPVTKISTYSIWRFS